MVSSKTYQAKAKENLLMQKKIGLVIICTVISYAAKKLKPELMMKLQHGFHSVGKKMYSAH
jgi:hypothetical protein